MAHGNPGYFGVGLFTNGAFYRNSADIRDDANWVHGNHTITFGGDWEHDQSIVRNTNLENGSLAFDASDYTDNALANFITGNLYSYSEDSGNWSDQHQNAQGIFIQDAWHASRRLTLDGGLRWEPQVPIQEVDGRVQQFFPGAAVAGVHSKVFPNAPAGLFFMSYVWPLPRFSGSSNRFVKTALGDWDWSGIFTRQSADVLAGDNNAASIAAGEDNSKTGLGNDRVNFVGNVSQLGTGAQQDATPCSSSVAFCVPFLNTSLFALPPTGQFGNIGEGAIAGPGYFDYVMSLMKNFYPISSHESFSVQLRGDFINVLNHPNFADPNVSLVGANFGRITGYNGNPRIIQLAMKIFF